MLEQFGLADKNAVVTGGSRNMGRHIALALAEAGANVAILDLQSQGAEAQDVVKEVQARGKKGVFLPLDLRDVSAIRRQVDALVAQWGHLDVLVNNAGKTDAPSVSILDYEPEPFDDSQQIMVRGTFFMSQAVARHMVKEGIRGSIVNIASRLGVQTRPNTSAYSTAKAAVVHMTRLMALELGPHGIRVNAVGPGPIPIPRPGQPVDVARQGQFDRAFLLGRGLRYDDIPGTVLYLASDASRMVTGQVIIIDGGLGLRGPI
jgi:NAD(P)-dependent dehydrogenase (short-subunit alcohol dehydrogenase family)